MTEDDSGRKKMRTTFTGRQIFDLEKAFESKKYLSSSERAEMASSLNVTQQQVTNIGLKAGYNYDTVAVKDRVETERHITY